MQVCQPELVKLHIDFHIFPIRIYLIGFQQQFWQDAKQILSKHCIAPNNVFTAMQ